MKKPTKKFKDTFPIEDHILGHFFLFFLLPLSNLVLFYSFHVGSQDGLDDTLNTDLKRLTF